ncbi:MAG: PBP1A family penicillin-binding protein [Tissierellales bacterium]|nr:PBP1A family penicillin-binding protein [Tissierellales bacterium]MBN2827886.1 PBP1A family penicillin-binding protein [Tissierellales bacterium]
MTKKKKKRKFSIIRFMLVLIILAMFVVAGAAIGVVTASIRNAPDIDPTIILSLLTESSNIVDDKGNMIEMIQSTEDRKIVTIDEIPDYLEDAFISIEDHRFKDHFGIDLRRIGGSIIHNIQARDLTAQGASTITQQLVKNLYLTNDKSFDRKFKEMYLAIEMERALTKDQILEYYLNTIPLGQSSNGVQAASFTYFSKDVQDLTLAEAALLAGIPKADSKFAPFYRYVTGNDTDVDPEDIVGYVYVSGTQYTCVYNEASVERQLLVLSRMLELGAISEAEYNEALAQDIRASLNPGQKKNTEISSYFTDYVKNQVVMDLMDKYGYDYDYAENLLYTGGFTIYSTMDLAVQKTLEESYANFAELLLGDLTNQAIPYIEEWKYFRWNADGTSTGNLDGQDNILNEYGRHQYFKMENIINDQYHVFLTPEEYYFDENNNLFINSKKFNLYTTVIDIVDYYTIEDNFLVTHEIGGLNIGTNFEIISSKANKGEFMLTKELLDAKEDFYHIDENDNLIISNQYFYYDAYGVFQPQSAAVILDYHNGQIKALIGGRNVETSKSFNRATRATRQPGSTIKPLSVYLPALDNGYTAASIIDDVPRYNEDGERWPKNWYENQYYKYWGITTLRKSVEYSLNVNAVTLLEKIGFDTSLKYLDRLHLADLTNPENDHFVTPEENRAYNDMNLAAMALGGLTQGFTPLDMTAAYGAIANQGVYIEPYAYTKMVDKNGKIVLDKEINSNAVVSPQVAYVMTDILKSTVTNGLSYNAALPTAYDIEVAGKTGTTSDNGDIWFVGYSPYYVGGIWIGNDNAQIRVNTGSSSTARFWGNIMKDVHADLEPASFPVPEGLVKASVCSQSGLLAGDLCSLDQRGSTVITEYFVKGTEPVKTCETHVEMSVCSLSGKLQSQYCPLDQLETRVFIKRDPLYDPILNPNKKDGNYEILLQTYSIYQKALIEIANAGDVPIETLEAVYAGVLTFENGAITHVNGIPVEDIKSIGLLTQDYIYQVPTEICNWHTAYHWNQYINSINGQDPEQETEPDETEAETESETTETEAETESDSSND